MDALELSLPANVVVSKIMATDGFARVGEQEARDTTGADASISGSRKASGCSPYRGDIKRPLTISGCSSVFRSKKADANLCMHENMLPSYKYEENGDTNHLGEADKPIPLSPKHEGKLSNRKLVKKFTSFPCPKRPRTDQTENSMRIARADDLEIISKEIASDFIGLTCPEKSLMVKKKRCQDGMRTDKRNYRASMRAKSFTLKAGFASSDSASGGNNVPGIYGLKSDLRDFTMHVDELSLDKLLDGSYKYPKACPDKGKKAPSVNENILLLVRKVCSVFPPHGVVDSNGNKKASLCLPNPSSCSGDLSDSDDGNKCVEESVAFIKDPCQANLGDCILYQPKVILERLALPPAHDLDALLNLSMTALPLQSTMNMTSFCRASLPPFPWSFSHSGSSKHSVDFGKLASTRNTCHGRWIRVGNNSTSITFTQKWFSELELKAFNHEDTVNQQKVDDLLQFVKSLNVPAKPSVDEPFSMSRAMPSRPEVRNPDSTISVKGSGVFGSNSKKLNLLEGADSLDSHLVFISKNHSYVRDFESEVGLGCQGNQSNLVDSSTFNLHFEESEVAQKEQHTGNTHGCSDCCYSYPCKGATDGCDQSTWRLPVPEISERGWSPRQVVAAEILCEMARSSKSIKTHNHTPGRINAPSENNTMEARKSAPSTERRTDRLFPAATHYDPVKSKHKSMMSERKNGFNSANDTARWSVSADGGASPGKLDRDLDARHPGPLHENPVRPSGLSPSPKRDGKDCGSQQKLRRVTMKSSSSSLGFGGTYIKDWSRGRSKRV